MSIECKFIHELKRELSGRLLAIWEGRSGLSAQTEEQYRGLWRTAALSSASSLSTIPDRLDKDGPSSSDEAACSRQEVTLLGTREECKVDGAGIVLGLFGMPSLATLQVRILRETCGDVPILLADDGSERDPELQQLADLWSGVEFWPSDSRRGHYSGDLSVFWKGFQWAHNRGLKWLVKLSQRFVFTECGWLRRAVDVLASSGEATLMQDCLDNGGGCVPTTRFFLRSECMGFDVPRWVRHYHEFDTGGELHQPTELYVWQRIETHFGGRYCAWPDMPADRYHPMPGTLWRATHRDEDYHMLAAAKGIRLGPDFTTAESQTIPGWKRG